MSINKVILVGNVGKDPEVRFFDNNVSKASFPFATSEKYKNKNGETVTNTEWHNIVAWRGLAQTIEKYVKKGTLLYIEGKITYRSFDGNDGQKKYFTEILADSIKILSKMDDSNRPASAQNTGNNSEPARPTETNSDGDIESSQPLPEDDLPF